MNFYEEFAHALLWKPRQALVALYWHLTRRRVRARNYMRRGIENAPYFYPAWMRTVERLGEVSAEAEQKSAGWLFKPRFSILLPCPKACAADELGETIASIQRQCYRDWELILAVEPGAPVHDVVDNIRIRSVVAPTSTAADMLRAALEQVGGDYVIPLSGGSTLSVTGLYRYAEALQAEPPPLLIYGDQDQIAKDGKRTSPWFKPRWNEEMFLAQDYISACFALETGLFRSVFSNNAEQDSPLHDILLAATVRSEGRIMHAPHIIAHLRRTSTQTQSDAAARLAAVARHVHPQGATVEEGPYRTASVRWPLPDPRPLVSIIVPTRDKVDLLKACIGSALATTTYPNYEIIVIDNDSSEVETLRYLKEISTLPNVQVIAYPHPYNYSAINNFAVQHCKGDYLCMLNNDTEVTDGRWLEEMMRQAVRPAIGAVGAKLLYDDGSIQHAGVVIGIGEAAGHAHRHLRAGQVGYFAQAHISRFVSAVTAACLVVERRKFELVGGLDEEGFAVAFNDVDLCLKLEKAGWRNVYVPLAVLVHHESRSRGKDTSRKHIRRYSAELALLQERWGTRDYADPLHHPALDRANESYVIKL